MTTMKVLSLLAVLAVLPTSATAAAQACDVSSLDGAYGFSLSGTNVRHSVLYAIVGRFEADGRGAIKGAATHSVQGALSRVTLSGTYTVNADCTGIAKLELAPDNSATLEFVVTSDLREIYLMAAGQGTVETGTARKQFATPAAPAVVKRSSPQQ